MTITQQNLSSFFDHESSLSPRVCHLPYVLFYYVCICFGPLYLGTLLMSEYVYVQRFCLYFAWVCVCKPYQSMYFVAHVPIRTINKKTKKKNSYIFWISLCLGIDWSIPSHAKEQIQPQPKINSGDNRIFCCFFYVGLKLPKVWGTFVLRPPESVLCRTGFCCSYCCMSL